jgi:hypothetical protein
LEAQGHRDGSVATMRDCWLHFYCLLLTYAQCRLEASRAIRNAGSSLLLEMIDGDAPA